MDVYQQRFCNPVVTIKAENAHPAHHNMTSKYKATIDWDRYWERETASKTMIRGGRNMAKRMGRFIERYDIRKVADFGCGPGITLFMLADMYPRLKFHGFDSSGPVIEQNREKAAGLGLDNLWFGREMLPAVRTRERFDLVYCIATLHYVEDIKTAIRNLYGRVSEGGFLIFNYPNTFTQHAYRKQIKPDDAENRQRFSLALAGKNLLTLEDIHMTLGKRPRSFWKASGEGPSRENVCVYVRR